MTSQAEIDRTAKRRHRELVWIAGVVAYTVLRFVIAWETLRRYGLNLWIFGLIDLGTAVPYAVGTSRLVTSFVDRRLRAAAMWMVVAACSFVAPYLYIAVAGRDRSMPVIVWVVLGVLATGLAINAAFAVSKRVRAARRLRRVGTLDAPS